MSTVIYKYVSHRFTGSIPFFLSSSFNPINVHQMIPFVQIWPRAMILTELKWVSRVNPRARASVSMKCAKHELLSHKTRILLYFLFHLVVLEIDIYIIIRFNNDTYSPPWYIIIKLTFLTITPLSHGRWKLSQQALGSRQGKHPEQSTSTGTHICGCCIASLLFTTHCILQSLSSSAV